MEHLEKFRPQYGSIKLLDEEKTILRTGRLTDCSKDVREKLEMTELIKAVGVASRMNQKYHAVVMEGYVWTNNSGEKIFMIAGGTSFNPGCRNNVNHHWTRLRHPTTRVTCARCLARIEKGI